jgi:6-phosphogluconolactonase
MHDPRVAVFQDLYAFSTGAAGWFAATAMRAAAEGREAWIALSGGSTPNRLFANLTSRLWRKEVPWHAVRICQVDERPVPPDHPDSNFRALNELLLSRVPIPRANVIRIPAELGPENAAREYEGRLRERLPVCDTGFPVLDLVFLGMGDDGHTASLFPNSPALSERERWVAANPVEKLGGMRVTLTYPVLNSAREVVFLVCGKSKAERVAEVLSGTGDATTLPAQGIQPTDGSLTWWLDAAAASCLPPADY